MYLSKQEEKSAEKRHVLAWNEVGSRISSQVKLTIIKQMTKSPHVSEHPHTKSVLMERNFSLSFPEMARASLVQ